MSENEVDQISRETAMMGRSALAAIQQWRMQNPGKTRIPRGVQKKALRLWRNEMAAHQVHMAHNRRVLRTEIAGRVEWHRQYALDTWARSGGYPSEEQREQLMRARQDIERTIARAPEFTATERGQAISALVSAHYATDPRKPAPPVWGGRLAGISALRARLADRLSRQQLGIAVPGRRGLGRPTTATAGLHSYWTQPRPAPSFQAPQPQQAPLAPQQPGVSTADIERIEARQRQLAEQLALANGAMAERDQLQAKVQDLGARYVDSQQLNRRIADDLASRGRELSDVHTELDRVRTERDGLVKERDRYKTERDEAVQKVIERTPAEQRLGSQQRQHAEKAGKPSARPPASFRTSSRQDNESGAALIAEAGEYTRNLHAAKVRAAEERAHAEEELNQARAAQGQRLDKLDATLQSTGVPEEDRVQIRAAFEVDPEHPAEHPADQPRRDPIPGHAFAGLVNGHDREREGMER